MKNIYDITKSQLVTLWFFGAVGFVWAANESCRWYALCSPFEKSLVADLITLIIPGLLIFYTLGWRGEHKK